MICSSTCGRMPALKDRVKNIIAPLAVNMQRESFAHLSTTKEPVINAETSSSFLLTLSILVLRIPCHPSSTPNLSSNTLLRNLKESICHKLHPSRISYHRSQVCHSFPCQIADLVEGLAQPYLLSDGREWSSQYGPIFSK